MTTCPDCQTDEHPRSECPAQLPCPYWADHVHCFTVTSVDTKFCRCGTVVSPRKTD